jgi:hypothetical protein
MELVMRNILDAGREGIRNIISVNKLYQRKLKMCGGFLNFA